MKKYDEIYKDFVFKYWVYTEGFGYLVSIPIVLFFVFYFGDFTTDLMFLALKISSVAVPLSLIYVVRQNVKFLNPFKIYFETLASNSTMTPEIKRKAYSAYANLPFQHSIPPVVVYFLTSVSLMIYFSFYPEINTTQYVNLIGSIMLSSLVCAFAFYNITEQLLIGMAEKGVFEGITVEDRVHNKKLVNIFSGNLMLIMGIFSLLVTLVVYNLSYKSIKDSILSQMISANKSNIFIVEEFLNMRIEELSQFSKNPEVILAIKQNRSAWINERLSVLYSNGNNFYENTFITSADEDSIVLYSGLPGGKSIGHRMKDEPRSMKNIEKARKGEIYISSAFPSPITKEAVLLITAPIMDGDELIGIVGFPVQIFKFTNQFLNKVAIGHTGYSIILDRNATIINHPDPKLLLYNSKNFPFSDKIAAAGVKELVNYNYKNENKIVIKDISLKYDGITSLSTIDLNDIELPALHTSIIMIVLIVVIGIGSSVFIYYIFANKLSYLVKNSKLVESMSKGDLTNKTNTPTLDEIGLISTSLNFFIDNLRGIVKNNQKVATEMAGSSAKMSRSIGSVSENSQTQASTAEEISAAIEEITSGAENVTQMTISQTNDLSHLLNKMNELSNLIQGMHLKINNASNKINVITKDADVGKVSLHNMSLSIQNISKSSRQITGVMEIINGISRQINLLALNAAIEAARAGEAGKGFAVVADEVASLASKTSNSINNINSMIKQNEEEISRGSEIISSTVQLIGRIIEAVNIIDSTMLDLKKQMKDEMDINSSVNSEAMKMKSDTDAIQLAMQEQKVALNEIAHAIYNISDIIQSNASSMSDLSSNSENISKMAENLKEQIDYFKV